MVRPGRQDIKACLLPGVLSLNSKGSLHLLRGSPVGPGSGASSLLSSPLNVRKAEYGFLLASDDTDIVVVAP